MNTPVVCDRCGKDCTSNYWMCDRLMAQWCSECFAKSPCGKGKHGEGCPTQVFDDSSSHKEE